MNLSIISNAVRGIVQVILKLNGLFDKKRSQLKALEKALNSLGKPGYWYVDDKSFSGASINEGVELYYLSFQNGIIKIKYSYCNEDGKERDYELSDLGDMSLYDVDSMLKSLPEFLQGYQKFLETEAENNEITLDVLTKVVEAINSVIAIKA